jgi:hypothetical protein
MTDILDDLFPHCALWAWVEVYEETGQWPPDPELTRQRAYRLFETEKRKEDDRHAHHSLTGD